MRRQNRKRVINHLTVSGTLSLKFLTPLLMTVMLCAPLQADHKDKESEEEHHDRSSLLEGRKDRRLSTYAPPTIPHEAGSVKECLECHGSHDSGAPKMPHKPLPNCRQCHVPQEDVPLFKSNRFHGGGDPRGGARLAKGSPPMMPHRVFMREDCLACHGEEARGDILHTPHPQRIRCQQCHLEQRPEATRFPPGRKAEGQGRGRKKP